LHIAHLRHEREGLMVGHRCFWRFRAGRRWKPNVAVLIPAIAALVQVREIPITYIMSTNHCISRLMNHCLGCCRPPLLASFWAASQDFPPIICAVQDLCRPQCPFGPWPF
jgi:hypothetical protein